MVTILGRAKINLTLDILGMRKDGFHEIATVMQSLSLSDTLTLSRQDAGITLTVDTADLETDERNLAYRAAALIMEEYGIKGGVHIDIVKRIPIAAGLAGGSGDAAAVLRGMRTLYSLEISDDKLYELGARLGSDIPFSLLGGTVFATGRGEVMKPLAELPVISVVLAKPLVAVSTAWAYRTYDTQPSAVHPDHDSFLQALQEQDILSCARLCVNVLEPVTERRHPVIAAYRARMRAGGAYCAMMSGSGPTVFGLCPDRMTAERIAEEFRRDTEAEVYVTQTVGRY
jgi:hypothetical protein